MGEWHSFARFVGQRPAFLAGLVIVGLTVFLAAVGPYIGPYPTETALPGDPLQPPSLRHPFGTDVSNMDIFSRVIAAPRIDLTIALVSTGIAFVFGVLLGVISGFFGGGERGLARYASEGIMRAADIVQAFPVFIFALALVGFRGPGAVNVIAALAFLNIPFFLRITRGAVLQVRERPFIEAARCAGNSEWRIAFLHVLPNALTPPVANISPTIGFSILLTSGLSFVGRRGARSDPGVGLDDRDRGPQHDDRPVVDGPLPGHRARHLHPRLCPRRRRVEGVPRPDQAGLAIDGHVRSHPDAFEPPARGAARPSCPCIALRPHSSVKIRTVQGV